MITKRHILMNAMQSAAAMYDRCSADVRTLIRDDAPAALVRVAEQFEGQAVEARQLCDDIEDADSITLED